ncbi:hypothetical protein AGOR_G00126270 [Albula goreensis]|uniref:Mitogen-activated protein kinase-binding protein 1-like n=1 Tax=Albula goreensis TaxID=1534307 RepID=A0A8T3DFD2_9TELE|nr:hypothetical protein AGOR_G00126270 [Albula goreensis]
MAEGPFCGGFNSITNFSNSRIKKTVNINVSSTMNLRKKNRQSQPRRNIHNRVALEKVLGITTSSSSGLTCDPNTGLVAYPAGCVVVILHPRKNKQSHILNMSRKTFTALAFSQDGKYLVTGESGHMPCVRVWDVAEKTQVAEVQCHKYGVACVAFSNNGSYIVSVGYQHDMTVSVWEWKKGTVIASNKVSSRVLSVSFSEDNSYFVTAGNRHVKFWYLDASKERRVNSTVPLIGRSGLLGEQRNSMFCGLACGWGNMAGNTYCITSSGLLCQFNSRRILEAWVDLKTSSARCLTVSRDYVFCGCAGGTVRVFNPQNLHYITTLHRPHRLGVDITQGLQPGHLFSTLPEADYPDTVALTFDPITSCLTCVYNDHSVYVWDVRDFKNVGKVYSALYHSGCVWSVETYPEVEGQASPCLPPGSFLTCSSDNTIRLWHGDPQHNQGPGATYHRNLYSNDLMKIVYVGKDTQHLQSEAEPGEGSSADVKAGIRILCISPDGQHLAAGDRNGNLRIFGLQFMDELLKIEAHDSEVLCLEFSPTETGLHLLASASRDRLIHIFNIERDYSLEQTVYDHSASITAIKFTGVCPDVRMVSCGADKSIYFRTAGKSPEGLHFSRSHHIVEKATLYDMDLDSTRTHTAVACQDRNIRVYNVKSGKLKRSFKGSMSDDGTLLKVQMDPSGMYLATSCSDKNICIFDYETGECAATLFGHSEIVTGMKFSQDCRHLITVSGDSCVFVWRLDSQMTNCMRKKLVETQRRTVFLAQSKTSAQKPDIRRQTFITVPRSVPQETGEEEEEEDCGTSGEEHEEHPKTPSRDHSAQDIFDPMFLQTNGKLPMWARRLDTAGTSTNVNPTEQKEAGPYQPRGRWAEQSDPQAIRSVLETRSLQLPLSPSPRRSQREEEEEEDSRFHPQSLDSLLGEEEEEDDEDEAEEKQESQGGFRLDFARPGFLPLPEGEELFPPGLSSPENSDYILYPANSAALSTGTEGEFDVKELCEAGVEPQREGWAGEGLSPDSACCVGSAESQASNQEHDLPHEDTDSLSQVSSTGSTGLEEEEEDPETLLRQHFDTLADCLSSHEKFDTDLRDLQPSTESIFLNPRLSISTRFLSRFQARARLGTGPGSRTTTLPPCISEESSSSESSHNRTEVSCKPSSDDSVSPQEQSTDSDKTQSSHPVPQSSDSVPSLSTQKPPLHLSGPERDSAALLPARPCRQSYMGTTASSRAKMSRSGSMGENLNTALVEEHSGKPASLSTTFTHSLPPATNQECKENLPPLANINPCTHTTTRMSVTQAPPPGNHGARAALQLDLSGLHHHARNPSPSQSPVHSPHRLRRRTVGALHPSALVTPTEMRSLGKEGRSYIASVEESLAPRGQIQARNPTQSGAPKVPQLGDTPSGTLSAGTVLEKSSGNLEPPSIGQQSLASDSGERVPSLGTPVQSAASLSTADAVNEAVNIQTCKRVVNELQHSMKTAVHLYSKVCSMSDSLEMQLQMRSILRDAFSAVQSELDSVCPQNAPPPPPLKTSCPSAEESPGRQLKDDRTVALLEKYSEMLLRIAEKKLDCN